MFSYKSLKSGTDIRGVASEGGRAPVSLTDEVVERIAGGLDTTVGQLFEGL